MALVEINLIQLPTCFQESLFCREIKPRNRQSSIVQLPEKYLVDGLEIEDDDQFFRIIEQCELWQLTHLPKEIFEYIFDHPSLDVRSIQSRYVWEIQMFKIISMKNDKETALSLVNCFIN